MKIRRTITIEKVVRNQEEATQEIQRITEILYRLGWIMKDYKKD
jgi:hypothetical protein